jgi:hypothetical protein
MSRFRQSLNAGREAVKDRRTAILPSVFAAIGLSAAYTAIREGSYFSALLALFFFVVVMPWLSWNYIKPQK